MEFFKNEFCLYINWPFAHTHLCFQPFTRRLPLGRTVKLTKEKKRKKKTRLSTTSSCDRHRKRAQLDIFVTYDQKCKPRVLSKRIHNCTKLSMWPNALSHFQLDNFQWRMSSMHAPMNSHKCTHIHVCFNKPGLIDFRSLTVPILANYLL